MSESRQILEVIINDFSIDKFSRFFREKSRQFVPQEEDYFRYNDDDFKDGLKLGEINFSDGDNLLVCVFEVKKELSERAGKRAQYEKAKKILKENQKFSAGIFIFYDQNNIFRFSLIYPESTGTRRQWNNFRRFTYFVSRDFTNKTFLKQIGEKDITKLDDVKSAFSITAVTDLFYVEFFKIYKKIVEETIILNKIEDEEKARDFILLFSVRTIFIGFIQKKKWIGDNEKFIQEFFEEYKNKFFGKNEFYSHWLIPLFFEALNSPQGKKLTHTNNDFSAGIEEQLRKAPYLNGGLFKSKQGYDTNNWIIPDKEIEEFFDFLFAHSFTIEENSLEDEDLQLNPEFLGIIFERLVNKADGAVYTPRTEVDLMCRLSLVKWLQKNLTNPIKASNLYELFFREGEKEEDQKEGSFSKKEAEEILEKLESLSICDPAVGSGAFLVGMMQVLDDVEQSLKQRHGLNDKNLFERKKYIIKNSLYGVEVKEWAVWICQLRLWLSLFVDAPDDLKNSLEPILPSLDFKIRQGDSLVQRVGSKAFPISGHILIQNNSIKRKISELKKFKIEYFDNKINIFNKNWDESKQRELAIYEEILKFEIEEKEEQWRNLKNIKITKTSSLFGDEEISAQTSLDLNKVEVEKLAIQITGLKEQKNILRSGGKPLVWSIEFAEVFSEKGGFDIVIGNPPYVRQKSIEDPVGKTDSKKLYNNYLQEMVKMDFPDAFPPKMKINAQSDLYTYFYIRGLRLLNPQGIHTFICSNSWLDVGYGEWLQKFFLKRAPVEFIIDNHAKRSFGAADVNTIISIIHAPQKKIDENHLIKFVAFKKPFEESIFTENLLAIENAEEILSNDIFRVYPITNKDLEEAGMEYRDKDNGQKGFEGRYIGDKWGGKYLKAPEIYFKIFVDKKNLFVSLSKTNELTIEGYIHGNNIGNKYPKAFYIESLKKIKTVDLTEESEGVTLFGIKDTGNSRKIANLLFPRMIGTRFFVPINKGRIYGQKFYKIIINNESKRDILAICLNSSLQYLQNEVVMCSPWGLGALSVNSNDVAQIKYLNNLCLTQRMSLGLFSRAIKSIFDECGIDPKSDVPIEKQEPNPPSDRAELDKIVFDALGLTEDERRDVYRAVCRLVWNRISKAKSV